MGKPFKDLTIKDAFMFAAVMVNPDQCGPFLKMVLGMDIVDLHVVTEKDHGLSSPVPWHGSGCAG